jgi:hypothetical protein
VVIVAVFPSAERAGDPAAWPTAAPVESSSLTFAAVIDEASIASLNVTVGLTVAAIPEAPSVGFVDCTVGGTAATTVKIPVPVPKTPSGSVMSALPAPVAAEFEIVMLAVTCPQPFTVTELTVMPVLANATAAPLGKLVPDSVTDRVRPCSAEDGLAEVTVGRVQPVISLE